MTTRTRLSLGALPLAALFIAAVVTAAPALAAALSTVVVATAQEPTFRSGVELMNLSVTVTDKKGRAVTDLAQGEFEVFEDNTPRKIVGFGLSTAASQSPIGLGLILDASESMTAERLTSMRTAVDLLLKKLHTDDELYFLQFATRTKLTTPWTTDRKSVLAAIRNIKVERGTSIYNAIQDGLAVSKTGKARKQVMLVITDGWDTTSTIRRQDVAAAANASDVLIYALIVDNEDGIGPMAPKSDPQVRQYAAELALVTDATGGRTQYVQGWQGLEDAITQLGKEITVQYEIAYQRPPADGQEHQIIVKVNRPEVSVRHRRTYLNDGR